MGTSLPDAWLTILVIVLLMLGGSGWTWPSLTSEMFFKKAGFVWDGLELIPWVFLRGSFWKRTGGEAGMFLLVSSFQGTWL